MNTKVNYTSHFFLLLGISILSMVVFSMLSMAMVAGFYKISLEELMNIIQSPGENLRDIWVLRITNGITLIGTFFMSSFIFCKATKLRFGFQSSLVTDNKKGFNFPLAVMLSVVCFLSVLLFEVFVQNLGTPGGAFGEYLRETQEKRNQLDKVMLTMRNPQDLIFTLLAVGIIPAVCEEVFFRGVLMRLLIGWTKRPHLAIFIQALAFSLMHFNYIGTLPILFIGVVFGYVVYTTGNLWYSIAMHFVNNGMLVCLIYFNQSPENWPDSTLLAAGIPALLLLIFLVLRQYKNRASYGLNFPKPEPDYPLDAS